MAAAARTEDEEGGEVESVIGLTMSDEDVEELGVRDCAKPPAHIEV